MLAFCFLIPPGAVVVAYGSLSPAATTAAHGQEEAILHPITVSSPFYNPQLVFHVVSRGTRVRAYAYVCARLRVRRARLPR